MAWTSLRFLFLTYRLFLCYQRTTLLLMILPLSNHRQRSVRTVHLSRAVIDFEMLVWHV